MNKYQKWKLSRFLFYMMVSIGLIVGVGLIILGLLMEIS